MAPNKENIQKWVDELESDRWTQIYGKPFGEEGEACATGVAFKLCERLGIVINNFDLRNFYGICPALATVKYKGEERYVTGLNDLDKLSFKEIAQCIKDTYL